MSSAETATRCPRCLHYFITHDPNFPYGCRALAFKSRHAPEREVQGASGMPCQTFAPKPSVKIGAGQSC